MSWQLVFIQKTTTQTPKILYFLSGVWTRSQLTCLKFIKIIKLGVYLRFQTLVMPSNESTLKTSRFSHLRSSHSFTFIFLKKKKEEKKSLIDRLITTWLSSSGSANMLISTARPKKESHVVISRVSKILY